MPKYPYKAQLQKTAERARKYTDERIREFCEAANPGIEENRPAPSVPFIIPTQGWDSVGDLCKCDVYVKGLTSDCLPFVLIDSGSEEQADKCGLSSCCESHDGMLRVFAVSPPNTEVAATLVTLETSRPKEDA